MVNSVVSAILQSPLHWLLSGGLAEIRVRGRRSGKLFSFPVGYQWDEGDLVILVSHAPAKRWWRNYDSEWPMELVLRGRVVEGSAQRIAPDSEEFVRLCTETMRRVPGLSRVFGVRYSRRHGLTDAESARLRQSVVAIRVRLPSRSPHLPG